MFKKSALSILSLLMILMLAAPATFAQDRRRLGPRARAILSAGAGSGIGAGVGGLLGGKRGAGVGALLGGGGATAAWLLKNRNDRRRLGRYGQPIATIGTGTALGAGVGALVRGKRGALIGAALGGGGTAAAYLLTNRNRRPRYAYNNGGSYVPARRYYTSSRRTRARRSCRC
jgi:hypothetical protein